MKRETVAALVAGAMLAAGACRGAGAAEADPPVVIYQDATRYALDNGHVTATISKVSGEIFSLRFEGRELLDIHGRTAPGRWFSGLSGGGIISSRVVIDPAGNQGERGEVSIGSGGPLLTEMRYSLGRGDHRLYAWEILDHPANAPAARVVSGGFEVRLDAKLFDYLNAGKGHTHAVPAAADWIAATPILSTEARRMISGKFAGQVVCGWNDAAMRMETPVYGFSGAKAGAGLWIINPSCSYLSRGGNVIEPTGWLDAVDGAPTLMNRWGGEPLAGAGISLDQGEAWSHVIGPFLLYCNDGSFRDAERQGKIESGEWPYAWGPERETGAKEERAGIAGKIVLEQSPLASTAYPRINPLAGQAGSSWTNPYWQSQTDVPTTQPQAVETLQHAMVGLSSDGDWQTNFFDDQYWVEARDDGTFSIAGVEPGVYTLHVYCDGQIGETSVGGVRLEAGKTLGIGTAKWKPRNYGQFVWQIGYPDRSAAEFRHGDDATRWGDWVLKPGEFPKVVNYVVGKSDPRKDWNCAEYPGSAWSIHFPLGFVPASGCGFIYVTLAGGSGAAHLSVSLNGNDISQSLFLPNPPVGRGTGAVKVDDIAHDQVRGFYRESVYAFPPADMQTGDNVLVLRVDGHQPTDGLMYDCLRMEIRADSLLMAGQGDQSGDLPVFLPKNGVIDGMKIKQTYQGDPSGKYGLNP